MTSYSFVKMHGLGNDFAVFYGDETQLALISKKVKLLSHRFTGIGFDQLLFVVKIQEDHFYFYIFNADGSQASQCLNGARCVARFLIEKAYVHHKEFLLENASGKMTVNVESFDNISLKISNTAKVFPEKITIENFPFTKISAGNDHLITVVKQLDLLDVSTLGKKCQSYFPNGINVGFVEILSDKELLLRTYERGVGETLCCASNTLAAVAVGMQEAWLASTVRIKFSLGYLTVSLNELKDYFHLTGPASYCYEGAFKLSDFTDKP